MHHSLRIVIALCCMLPCSLWAQQKPAQQLTRFFSEQDIDRNSGYTPLDSSIDHLEIFHPGFRQHVFQDLGNIGTASQSLRFGLTRQTGFSYAANPFEMYFLSPLRTQYINTKSPYSDIFYAQGSNELLLLKLKHAQNINPRWNIGIDFNRTTSQGFQLKQITSLYNYQFFTSYTSKNLRYIMLASATWNRGVTEENGGILSDSVYESLTGASKIVNTRIEGTSSTGAQTRFKSRDAYLKNYYRFGRAYTDINEKDTIYRFSPTLQLSHTLHAHEISYIFENSGTVLDSALLPNRFYDTGNSTFDSAYFSKLSNTIHANWLSSTTTLFKDTGNLRLYALATHELVQVAQPVFIRRFDNVLAEAGAEFYSLSLHKPLLAVRINSVLSGYNAGDYMLHAEGRLANRLLESSVRIHMQQFRPDFMMQLFKSNAFIWNNDFDATTVIQTGISVSTRTWRNNFHLHFDRYALTNWVYYDTDVKPKQLAATVAVNVLQLSKTIQLWRFHLEHYAYLQQSNSSSIRLPEFAALFRYSYRAKFFGMTKFQLGFDIFYRTAYLAQGYNPATRMFHLQNEVRVGNYPLIDPFIAAQIKRANIFVKYEHANENFLFRTGQYFTPHYPVSQASFRFGIRWRFYD
jgi:hypothetical protein